MKKLLLLLLLSLTFIGLAYAHSGNTDSKGGHWNHSTITYHCHTCNSNSGDDDYFPSYGSPCSKHPEFARGINGMVRETKEQCLERFRRQREMFLMRLTKERLERDKNNSFINLYLN